MCASTPRSARPPWRIYIGQETIKDNLRVAIEAATARGESLDHILLHGRRDSARPRSRAFIAARWG